MRYLSSLLAIGLTAGTMAWSQPKFTISEIPPVAGLEVSKSSRISNNGVVVGWSEGSAGLRPQIFKNGVSQQIGGSTTNGYGFAINDFGVVAGTMQTRLTSQAARIDDFSATNLVAGRPVSGSTAYGINNRGVIVGTGRFFAPGFGDLAFSTVGGVAVQLPIPEFYLTSGAYDINDNGLIVGGGYGWDGAYAVTWQDGVATKLPNPSGTGTGIAYAVNSYGQIAGGADNDVAVWSNGQATNIGRVPGSTKSFGLDINDDGLIVGEFNTTTGRGAFLYKGGQFFDLSKCVTNGSGWVLAYANGINNNGQIVGTGTFNGQTRAFLLTPQ